MSLEEVWQRIDALKEDLEQLGVEVHVSTALMLKGGRLVKSGVLMAVIHEDLEEEP